MKPKAKYLLVSESMYEFAAGLFGPIYAIFVEKIGGGILAASWAWSVFAIVIGVTLLVMGRIEDRLKKDELVVVIGFALAAAGFLGYVFVSELWHLFLVQAILGFGWAFGTPALDSVYARNLEKGKTDSQWGAWEASMHIVSGISAFIGGIIATLLGFKVLFLLMFGVAVTAVFVAANILRKKRRV